MIYIVIIMRKLFLPAFLAVAAICSTQLSAADVADDPVLMTVDGHDVHVSEFVYLYQKNNTQQVRHQDLNDYLKLFIDYKLKVADAEHAGIDQTPEFQKEYGVFRKELSRPYMRDQAVEDSLVAEAYAHRKQSVTVSHIMLPPTEAGKATADSLRAQIAAGNISYEDAARQYSIDKPSAAQGGMMGEVVPDRYPWAFEKAAYATAPGQISPVVNSGAGYHIIRTESVAPASGQVLAEHILLLTRGVSPEKAAEAKTRIDSIYNVAKSGADFAELASRFSEDPGSAKEGGRLPWFSRGQMVPEFEATAFSMPVGDVSEPFATSYGYHIIHKLGQRDIAPLDEVRASIVQRMSRDERGNMPENAVLDKVIGGLRAGLDSKGLAKAEKIAGAEMDSAKYAAMSASDIVVANFGKRKITLAEVMSGYAPARGFSPAEKIESATLDYLREVARDYALDQLAKTNTEYRNLSNEYRDGILLYDISSQRVWDKAAKDPDGLEAYFKAHADRYAWTEPRFKGMIIFATSDSIMDLAMAEAATLDASKPADFAQALRKKFGRDVKVERVVAAKGENPITDFIAFGGDEESARARSKWASFRPYNSRMINAPEEAADVRGAAITDFQNELEQEWLKELHEKYSVKVNEDVFNKLKGK